MVYSKKDLESIFGISDNTVYKTLKACGLDTSRTEYTDEEIETRFRVARKLLGSGQYTYKDVERHFELRDAKASAGSSDAAGNDDDDELPDVEGDPLSDAIAQEVKASVQEIVRASVREIVPYIPRMAAAAFIEVASSGEIRRAFQKYRDAYIAGRAPTVYEPTASIGELPGAIIPGDIADEESLWDDLQEEQE
jgi:hypothetical protein